MERVEGNVWGEANDDSHDIGGEVHYQITEW